ncbi:hypothetical protein Noda2021_00010 [Candidatus Dependentiae bacterium Noda2021]|nr:hypothetical protein Noda2021_00010 [Candidatus Dependentiae bacterium Noda2021]
MNKLYVLSLLVSFNIITGAEKGNIVKNADYTCTSISVADDEEKVSTAFFSASGKKCAAIAQLNKTYLTSLALTEEKPFKKTTLTSSTNEFGWCGTFNNTEKLLAIGRDKDGIELWDTQTGRHMHSIQAYEVPYENLDCISSLHFTKQEFHLAVGHTNSLLPVKIFDIEKSHAVTTFENTYNAGIASIAINANNTLLISFEESKSPLVIWDYRQRKVCAQLVQADGIIKALASNNDNKIILGQTKKIDDVISPRGVNAHITVLDTRTNNSLWNTSTFYDAKNCSSLPTMGSVAITDDSTSAFSSMSCYLNQYSVSANTAEPVVYQGHSDKITHILVPAKDVVYTVAADKMMRIWNINKQQEVKKRSGRCITM